MLNREVSIEDSEAESFLISGDVNPPFAERMSTKYKLEKSQIVTIRCYRAVICFLLVSYILSAILLAFRFVRMPSQSLPSQGFFPPCKPYVTFRVFFKEFADVKHSS